MTTPAPPPQPPPSGLDDPAVAVAVASALAGIGGPAITIDATVRALKAQFLLTAAVTAALTSVLGLVTRHPHPLTGVIGPASAQTARQNLARRAQYVIAATRRVLTAASAARARGQSPADGIRAQLARERKFFEQHQAAMWNRATAAGKTDMAAAEHGTLLGWYATDDPKTSPECRAADGKNFYATSMPAIGFPGGVHDHCRCLPGPAHKNAVLLPGSRAPRYARAA